MEKFSDFPISVKSKSSDTIREWSVVTGMVAKVGIKPDEHPENEVMRVDSSTVIVKKTTAETREENIFMNEGVPVYQLGENGPFGVPNGSVFLRVKKGTTISDHRERLRAVGFLIEKESKSTGSGWIRCNSGSLKDALILADALHEISGVEVVEPQFTMPKQTRTTRRL